MKDCMEEIIPSTIKKHRKVKNDDHLSAEPEWRGIKHKTEKGQIICICELGRCSDNFARKWKLFPSLSLYKI